MELFALGVLGGLMVTIPVGAVAVLLVEVGLRQGFRAASVGAVTVALVDTLCAFLAVALSATLLNALAQRTTTAGLAAGLAITIMGGVGLYRTLRTAPPHTTHLPPSPATSRLILTFLLLTLLNPLTLGFFMGMVLALPHYPWTSTNARVWFPLGVLCGSLIWQLFLAGLGAWGHQRLGLRWRRRLSVAGYVLVTLMGIGMLAHTVWRSGTSGTEPVVLPLLSGVADAAGIAH